MKKIYGIFSIVLNLCFYWCSIYIFSNDKTKARLEVKSRWQNKVNTIIRRYFFNKIEINGNIEQNNNSIDVIIANHISTIDFIIIITILHNFRISDYYFVLKDSLVKIPVFGDLIGDDIHLTRNWENDKELIVKQIKKIKSGKILIYPEGTRYDKKKHKKSKQFCLENKLPIYNYTLAPRVKGLHSIISLLKSENRFGNLYDITLILPKFINRDLYGKRLISSEDMGKLYVDVRKINISEKVNDIDYEQFKKQLYYIWLEKNIIIDKIKRKVKGINQTSRSF